MQIRALFLAAFLAVSIGLAPATASIPTSTITVAVSPAMFDTEAAAQNHCPRDVVVWLNTPTGVYHEKGMRWYGRTTHGAFVCKKEADAAGDRNTRNGQ
jgi:hypothetical protein